MAQLDELMTTSKEWKSSQRQKEGLKATTKNNIGRKRRAWLEDKPQPTIKPDNNKGVYRPDSSTPLPKESIDHKEGVYKPVSSTPLAKGSIDHKKKNEKNAIVLNDLRGNPYQLILLLFNLTKESDEPFVTVKVKLKELMQQIDKAKDSVRTALRFLLKNKLITRIEFKAGQYGWSKYKLEQRLFNTINESIIKGLIDPFTPKGSISSSYINNNITTTKGKKTQIPTDWQRIDYEDLKPIGFSATQLKQLVDKSTPELVQDSICQFAYGLENNSAVKKYTNPLNVLMGVLRKGQGWNEQGYISPKERAMQTYLAKQEAEKKRLEEMEKKLFDLEYEKWRDNQDNKFQQSLVDPKNRLEGAKIAAWRIYFRDQVWDDLKTKLSI